MSEELSFEPSCDMVGNTIYCSIETNIINAEFAFYVNIDGERKATFWYDNRPSVEYICGDEIINTYEIVFFIRIGGEEIISKQISVPRQEKIEIKLGKSNPNSSFVDKAIFIDNKNRQELSIKIESRIFNQNYLDLKKYWDIILS